VATDPVALDTLGCALLEEVRRQAQLPTLAAAAVPFPPACGGAGGGARGGTDVLSEIEVVEIAVV
jgi:hypothetical protein